jgi:nickel transport protein
MQLRGKCSICATLFALAAAPVWAHGTILSAEVSEGVQLHARFDTGEPMAQAQIAIFAPIDPTQIWARGTTDTDGRFAFVPDAKQPGIWTVQVRQAGHGAMINVTTGAGATAQVVENGLARTPAQKLLMVALVVWGALGTALYFRRKGRTKNASA